MDELEKVRKKVERLKDEIHCGGYKSAQEHSCDDCMVDIYQDILSIIDSMQKESVSEDLWNVAEEYALRQVKASTDTKMTKQAYLDLYIFRGLELAVAFKDGANWQLNKIRREYEKNRG